MTYEEQKAFEQKYPESAKLSKIHDKSQEFGEFLSWLTGDSEDGEGHHYVLAEYIQVDDGWGNTTEKLVPTLFNIEKILAEFFQIDLIKLEKERRQMIEELRAAQGEGK